jgi:hypothetical protein
VSERHGPAVRIRRNFASSDLELFSPAGGTVHELIYSEIGNEVLLIKYVDSVPVIKYGVAIRPLVVPQISTEKLPLLRHERIQI